jgi:hypothetical protein
MYDNKKRRTRLCHMCNVCHRSYSRRWVLKRHIWQLHQIHALGDSPRIMKPDSFELPKNFKTLMEMDMAKDLKELNSKLSDGGLDGDVKQVNSKATKLATKLIKPAWESINKLSTFYQEFLDQNVPFPRVLVSGYSCYLCHKCLAREPPVPIKDLGIDLTCEGRHHCRTTGRSFNTISTYEKLKLGNEMFRALFLNIARWIHAKKLIIAKKIDVPSENDDGINLKYIKEKYEIPNKYHLEDVDFHRSPWIQKLLRNGKIEPTNEQLIDFSAYCVGTYAILRIRDLDLFEYYSVFLASAESIEKPDSPLSPA